MRSTPLLLLCTLLSCTGNKHNPGQATLNDSSAAAEAPANTGSTSGGMDTVTCTDFQVEMGKGTRCFYPGRTQQDAYRIVLKEYRDESKHLMPVIPATDTTYESNRDNEQVDVAYTIGKNNTHITLNYPGGVTEIEMTEANSSTTLRVIYNAD